MKNPPTYSKVCRTPEQAVKEHAVLHVLQVSSLQHLSPRPIKTLTNPLIVKMSYISGKAPTPNQLGHRALGQLGETLRELHYLRPCATFGSFDANLNVPLGHATFDNFLQMEIKKWSEWHAPAPDSYLSGYISWLWREHDTLQEYFRSVDPLFCHGDIDAKNLILQDGELTGLVDWGHAGAYCLAWELRKIPRILQHDWQWHRLLSAYSAPDKLDWQALRAATQYLNAADLLGHLRWCRLRNLSRESEETLYRMYSLLNPREAN